MKTAKVETEIQKAERKAKEQKELARRQEQLKKPKSKMYFWYLMLIIALICICDEVASILGTQMQSEIAGVLFDGRLGLMQSIGFVAAPIAIFAIYYKSLADKYGRRPFLWLSCLGMASGLFVIFLAGQVGGTAGIAVYVLGITINSFFITNDVHALYILETAPPHRRQTYVSIATFIATGSAILIPVLRRVVMGDDITRWNLVYLVPSIIIFIIAFVTLTLAKETDVFLRKRIEYLEMSDEERVEEIKTHGKESEAQGGIIAALKFASRNKQLRWIYICSILLAVAGVCASYYQSILGIFYEVGDVNSALMTFAIGNATVRLVSGILADKYGRKSMSIASACLAIIALALSYFGSSMGMSPWIAGLAMGIYVGGYWFSMGLLGTMTAESVPTNLRASAISGQLVMGGLIGGLLASIIPIIILFATNDNIPLFSSIIVYLCLPAFLLPIILIALKVKDTTHVNLDTVKGNEWN